MSRKVILVFALLVVLITSDSAASPQSAAAGQAKGADVLQRLLAKREEAREASATRAERRAHLSEDEREIMTKQVMQAIAEVMNSDCMLGRDYQGWVDFGRRDAEE